MPYQVILGTRVFACAALLCASSASFAAPALNDFMQQVWDNSPSIKSSSAALDAAKANKQAASKPIYNPEVGFDAEKTNVNRLSIGFSQSVDWGNKRAASSNIAGADIQTAQADLALQRTLLAQEVLSALVAFDATQQMQALAEQRVNLMQDFVDNTEKRQQVGDVGLQDVALARVALSEAQMLQAKSLAQQAENDARLSAATGIFTVGEWPMLINEPPAIPRLNNAQDYLNQLPALMAFKAQFLAAKSNVSLAQATSKADPTFGVLAGVEDTYAVLGLSFSIPLNIRNNYRAEIEVANQNALQIEHMYLFETQRATADINGAYRRYQLTYDAWQTWKKTGLNSLKEQMDLIQTIWKSGDMSTSDYLVQSKQNVDAKETAVDLSAQMWKSWVEWLVASGQIENWINETK